MVSPAPGFFPVKMAPVVRPCTWCGTEVEGDPSLERIFCCTGCETAALWVTDAGLGSYFDKRDLPAPR